MEYSRLIQKKEQLAQIWDQLPKAALESFERSFDVEYAHNSTAIEGNTLTLIQTKALLEDGTIAASTTNLLEEFRNLLGWGIPMRQAVKAVTINPARAIRADGVTGSIEPGKLADLVALDEELRVRLVLVRGQIKVNNL